MLKMLWLGSANLALHIAAMLGVMELLNTPSTLDVYFAVVMMLGLFTFDVLTFRFYKRNKNEKDVSQQSYDSPSTI